jgi:hypothetical protein
MAHIDTKADDLNLKGAVLGEGLVLRPERDGRLTIHAVEAGRVTHVGTFESAAAALAALDELDEYDELADVA